MRFPPANGFAGSAVWQLAQSPASTSALPWAMVSAEGTDDCASASPQLNAVHKNAISQIARIARCRDGTKGSFRRYITQNRRNDHVTPFRARGLSRHKPK